MVNLTVFQGRQCTRVRRAVVPNPAPSAPPKVASGANAPGAAVPAATTRASTTTTSTISSSTPAVPAVPNLPGIGGQATVLIPLPLVQLPPVTSAPRPQAASTQGPATLVNPAPTSIVPVAPAPPAANPTAVPKAPQPQPPAGPQSPSVNPSPTQQEGGKPQSQAQTLQPSGPFASLRPLTQLPLSQTLATSQSAETSQGRGAGSTSISSENGVSTSQTGQAPKSSAQQSSQIGQLVPPLSQAQGTESKSTPNARPTLVPVLITSNGVTRTTLVLPSSTARGRNTETVRSASKSLSSALPTRSPGIGAGAAAGAGTRSAKSNNVPIIAGVVSAFVVIIAVCGIIFFRARRKRNTPKEITSRYRDSTSTNGRNIRAFFANRLSRSNYDYGRSTPDRGTPTLERGMDRLPYMTEVDSYRRRSSSEPATNRSVQKSPSIGSQGMLPTASTLIQPPLAVNGSPNSHRRSVSSLSGLAYPILTENNNPFKDPEPNAQLRIVNPDFGRSGSSASSSPRTPAQDSATTGSPGSLASGGIVATKMSLSPLKQASSTSPPRPIHQRSPSILQDPFRDVETIPEDPFADPGHSLPTIVPARSSRTNHKRNKSSLASSASQYSDSSPEKNGELHQRLMAGIPLITTTAPSSIASSHRYQNSRDSAMISRNESPTPSQASRFDGLGISNILPRSSRVPRTSLLPTTTLREANSLQPVVSAMMPPPSPVSNSRISHNRLSSTSSASDLSLSFPASWGSPGPTRPASIATQGGPSFAAALAAANGDSSVRKPRDSSASDPFDLDDLTLLQYAASEAGGYRISTLTRNGTQRKADQSSR